MRDAVVLVASERSPQGQPIPIAWVQEALDRLLRDGEVEASVDALGYRSAFVAAALLTLPGTSATPTSPPRIVLRSGTDGYRRQLTGELNAWWESGESEIYWLEITDRPDIGVDLHAPQRDAAGNRSPGYSLICWVERGDVIFHYDRNERAITHWSRAVGELVEAPVVWLSHRAVTRRRLSSAREQPGWWLDLDGPYPLTSVITLAELRVHGGAIKTILQRLQAKHTGALYFPFFFYRGEQLRPMQPYLNKLPARVVSLLPSLAEAAELAATTHPFIGADAESSEPELGTPYREASVSVLVNGRDPFTVDPAVVERGLAGHANTQNALAEVLRQAGLEPRSPRADEPNFDLAWQQNDIVYIAEVKSTTVVNEERQLRLGLGQVLRYRRLLQSRSDTKVRGVLVAERQPRDPTWRLLCDEVGIRLLTPDQFSAITSSNRLSS